MKPELPDRVAAMAWCTPVQVTAPASITQRRRLTNVDLCSKQTEGEAAELADALKQMSRKVKLLSVWKPQVPIWASCHTQQDFPLGVSLPLGNWSVSGKRQESPSCCFGEKCICSLYCLWFSKPSVEGGYLSEPRCLCLSSLHSLNSVY